uniref:Uncharacterized protein n=1 Tax=Sinocyclocheilus grahami TaxID=75366 RepID=A0A672QYI3_SINGR
MKQVISLNQSFFIYRLSDCSITEEGYKTLTSSLKSNSHLTELDLRGNYPGQSGVEGLIDLQLIMLLFVFRLNNCKLTEKSCSVLATVLSSKTILKEMNLNNSRLLNSGVKEICEGLKNPVCELKILNLRKCGLTEESCSALATVLRSNSSLKELDMSNNNLQDSGVKKLQNGLENTNCTLQKLSLRKCGLTEESCSALATVLRSNSSLKELDMSNNNLQDSGVKKLQNGLENTNSYLFTFLYRFNCISITAEGCATLASAFNSNPSNLIELDLSGNKLENSGVTEISGLLGNSQCTLQILRLGFGEFKHELKISVTENYKYCYLKNLNLNCSITEEGYKALASALRSSPSHLIELDLTGNDPGPSGVKQLKICEGLKNPQLHSTQQESQNILFIKSYIKLLGEDKI